MKIRVKAGSPLAEVIGFSNKLFYGYFDVENLDCGGHKITLMYILSLYPGVGNTKKLIKHWVDSKIDIDVDRPNDTMKHILLLYGFRVSPLYSDLWEWRSVWS